jgi:hypothetical protein
VQNPVIRVSVPNVCKHQAVNVRSALFASRAHNKSPAFARGLYHHTDGRIVRTARSTARIIIVVRSFRGTYPGTKHRIPLGILNCIQKKNAPRDIALGEFAEPTATTAGAALVEPSRNLREGRDEFAADRRNDSNDSHSDARCNQSVLDRCRAVVVDPDSFIILTMDFPLP